MIKKTPEKFKAPLPSKEARQIALNTEIMAEILDNLKESLEKADIDKAVNVASYQATNAYLCYRLSLGDKDRAEAWLAWIKKNGNLGVKQYVNLEKTILSAVDDAIRAA